MDLFNLKGKHAIVTGGTGGIGKALTKGLLEAGVEVAVLDYSSKLDVLKKELSEFGKMHTFQCNLADKTMRCEVFDQAVQALNGNLDILVNSAGVQKRGKILDFKDEDWDFVMEVNINAVFAMTQCAGKYMLPKKKGKIINIASMNSYFGGTNVPPYASSKGAVVQLTKAIANEWSAYGINANAIAPGFIETPMTADMKENKEVYEYKRNRIPKGRWGLPEDLIGTLLYLCSDASDYVCGVTIPVDGGYLCK
ncbi:MAG: SDR family oxidoreductase [Eubacterium sp.]|nr:SDR family oxidoreductase [Eubacterium sp.]